LSNFVTISKCVRKLTLGLEKHPTRNTPRKTYLSAVRKFFGLQSPMLKCSLRKAKITNMLVDGAGVGFALVGVI